MGWDGPQHDGSGSNPGIVANVDIAKNLGTCPHDDMLA